MLTYAELAKLFFASHNPCRTAWSTQYRSAAFPRSSEQRSVLEAAASQVAKANDEVVHTAIEDYSGFTLAEDYHQKYRLRRVSSAIQEFEAMFPTTEAFLASVAVTKANAFVGGYGTSQDLRQDDPAKGRLGQLGLSPTAQAAIQRVAR